MVEQGTTASAKSAKIIQKYYFIDKYKNLVIASVVFIYFLSI